MSSVGQLYELNCNEIRLFFRNKANRNKQQLAVDANNHEKEELEAAEALTSLAGNYRNRMIEHS